MNTFKSTAIIVAGGSGSRIGGDLPKQFLPLGGRPLILHTLEAFERCADVNEILLVLPESHLTYFSSEILPQASFSKLKKIIPGGKTRQDSTQAGFQNVDSQSEIVLVHDGARPLIHPKTISDCIQAAKEFGAALAASLATDTIKETNPQGFVTQTHPREKIYHAQTPQAFRYAILKEALAWAATHAIQGTDEASLVEQMGKLVKIVEAEPTNIKVTNPADFSIAEALLKRIY